MNKRDKNKRLKGFGIPVELCVRYERMAGVKTGEEPTPKQKRDITRLMVTALTVYAANVPTPKRRTRWNPIAGQRPGVGWCVLPAPGERRAPHSGT